MPNDNDEERGFFIPLSELINTDESKIANNLNLAAVQIEEFGENELIRIFPNPFKNQVTMKLYAQNYGEVKVEIFLSDGRLVYSNYFTVSQGLNNVSINEELKNVQGLLQMKITFEKDEVFFDRIIKLE